jgi:hypothetical protein
VVEVRAIVDGDHDTLRFIVGRSDKVQVELVELLVIAPHNVHIGRAGGHQVHGHPVGVAARALIFVKSLHDSSEEGLDSGFGVEVMTSQDRIQDFVPFLDSTKRARHALADDLKEILSKTRVDDPTSTVR